MDGVEAVRKRPGMYVGGTDSGALQNLVTEVAINAIKEGLAGYCAQIEMRLEDDGSVCVRDDGRGLPVDLDTRYGLLKIETILTRLHAYHLRETFERIPGELHGVGLCVVNALSEWLNLRIWRDGLAYTMAFQRGRPLMPLTAIGGSGGRRGTEIAFLPDRQVFPDVDLNFAILEARIGALGSLGANAVLTLTDGRVEGTTSALFKL